MMISSISVVVVVLLVCGVSADRWVLGREGNHRKVIMTEFDDRLAIADRLMQNADKENVGDFLEMIVQWTRGKNVLKEEDCTILNFG